jgi:hypothetical protein
MHWKRLLSLIPITTDFNNTNDAATSVAMQRGEIIVGGSAFNSNNTSDLAFARYAVDVALDSSFGVNGKVLPNLSSSTSVQALPYMKTGRVCSGKSDYQSK